MFKIHSVVGRISVGILVGLVIGIIVLVFLSQIDFMLFSLVGFGMVILFMIMGMLIGFIGMFDRHPVFDFKMKWWIRGPVVGMLFMFMLALLSHDPLAAMMQSPLLSWTGLTSPFWAVIDGFWIGALIGWLETHIAGEGEELPLT